MLKRMKKFKEIALAFRQEDKMFDDTALLFDDHTTLFQIGASLDNLGKILIANKGAQLMTGYSLRELESMNIRQILPNEFSKNHNTYMLNAYKTGQNKILYKHRSGLVRHKKGHIVHVLLLVKPLFSLSTNEFRYMGYL